MEVKFDGQRIASARDEWLKSIDGQQSANPLTLGANEHMREYLENRLVSAFEAGVQAAEAILAEAFSPRRPAGQSQGSS